MAARAGKHSRLRLLLILAVVLVCAAALLARVELHTVSEQALVRDAFLGYLDGEKHGGRVTVAAEGYPAWLRALAPETMLPAQTLDLAEPARIGIFADLRCYENRFERRAWLSGHLLESAEEHYAVLAGAVALRPVTDARLTPVPRAELRPADYDYTQFRGSRTKAKD